MSFRSIFDAGELKSELEKSGVKPSFIPYIWKQVIQNPDAQLDQIPSLPSAAYPLLTSKFKTLTSCVHSAMNSSDQLTTKLLIKLQVCAFLLLHTTHLIKCLNERDLRIVCCFLLEWGSCGGCDYEVRYPLGKVQWEAPPWWNEIHLVRIISGIEF